MAGKRGVCGGAGVMELVGQGESSLTGWAEGFGLYPVSGGELLGVCMQSLFRSLFRRTHMEAPCGWMGEPGGREATV